MRDVIDQLEQYGEALEHHVLTESAVVPTGVARTRRGYVWAAAAAVVLALVVAVVVVRGGGDTPARLSAGVRSLGADVPPGWKVVENHDAGVRLSVPESWSRLDTIESGGGAQAPREVLTVGTESLPRSGVLAACTGGAGVPGLQIVDRAGTWVSVYEYPEGVGGPTFELPTGESAESNVIADRPESFLTAQGFGGDCPVSADEARAFRSFLFRDDDRLFVARVVAVGTPADSGLEAGYEVLDTLGLSSPGPVTTVPTTSAVTTTVPTPGATVAVPATGPTSPDADGSPEAAARAVFLAWLNAGNRDAMGDIIEDYESIGEAHRAGIAQHTEADLAQYSGRVEAVRVLDETHVSVTYSVLHGGRPAYPNQAGIAVKVDGRWLVSRETVCALLGFGGITCPPRA